MSEDCEPESRYGGCPYITDCVRTDGRVSSCDGRYANSRTNLTKDLEKEKKIWNVGIIMYACQPRNLEKKMEERR